jgi:formamidopyrimidine-DNA glycosylase
MLWFTHPAERHALLRGLGMEPLEPGFDGRALQRLARGRRVAVKPFIMNGRVVTGVGNIYAAEALFEAGIHPMRSVARISPARWDRLAEAVRATLERALEAGGTTLRDFASADGHAGEFQARCAVYGREGLPCPRCATAIRALRQGQRSTFYCPGCQR